MANPRDRANKPKHFHALTPSTSTAFEPRFKYKLKPILKKLNLTFLRRGRRQLQPRARRLLEHHAQQIEPRKAEHPENVLRVAECQKGGRAVEVNVEIEI